MALRILGIAGSLRQASFNRRLLAAAGRRLPAGAELVVWEGLATVPPFDEDAEEVPPPAVLEMRRMIRASDGLLIATPEYNRSIPGQLKNAIDWASRPPDSSVLAGKPAAVTGASPTPRGAAAAQAELRKVLAVAGASPVEVEAPVPQAFRQFDPGGELADPALRDRIDALLDALLAQVRAGVGAEAIPV